jgi:basic membrane lipoprotein Med (substrate-binding protein (PBP1-ABC) superfamily)
MSRRIKAAALVCLLAAVGCEDEHQHSLPVTVSVLYPLEGKGELAMADSMFDGIVAAHLGGDFELHEIQPGSADEAEALLEQTFEANLERALIVTGGELYAEAVNARACDFDGAMVLQLEGVLGTCPNLRSVMLDVYGPAYLAGVMAVAAEELAPRRALGILATTPNYRHQTLIDGLIAGAVFAGGTVLREDVVVAAGGDDDAPLPELALEEFLGHVDVVAVIADARRAAVLDALRQYNESHEPVLLIALAQDLTVSEGEIALGSVLERWDVVVRDAILAARADAFAEGRVRQGFRDGATELYVNPAYADTAVEAQAHLDCEDCATLQDAVDAAEPRAADEALAYHAY